MSGPSADSFAVPVSEATIPLWRGLSRAEQYRQVSRYMHLAPSDLSALDVIEFALLIQWIFDQYEIDTLRVEEKDGRLDFTLINRTRKQDEFASVYHGKQGVPVNAMRDLLKTLEGTKFKRVHLYTVGTFSKTQKTSQGEFPPALQIMEGEAFAKRLVETQRRYRRALAQREHLVYSEHTPSTHTQPLSDAQEPPEVPLPIPSGRDTTPEDFLVQLRDIQNLPIYAALQARWDWQDQLMWSRTQWLMAIQAVSFASLSASGKTTGVGLVFFLAGILSFVLHRLATLDERNRDNTASLMNAIIRTNIPVDHTMRGTWKYVFSGGGIIRVIIILLTMIDFLVTGYVFFT